MNGKRRDYLDRESAREYLWIPIKDGPTLKRSVLCGLQKPFWVWTHLNGGDGLKKRNYGFIEVFIVGDLMVRKYLPLNK